MPTGLRFIMGTADNGSDNQRGRISIGTTDGTNSTYNAMIAMAGQDPRTRSGTGKCIKHYDWVSGTFTGVTEATFVSFDNLGGGQYGFTLNFTQADADYPITFEAFD